ncbi:MAG TPA: helix-turn-helix domain-containing protein [Herpetosiphonaceae bacterium]|nr:helix-turn-helix domain-containing protein [Herpetosiphonaceae bacterium]
MTTTTAASGEGLTIHEAAAVLGMSPSTVRRHIKEGRLHATRRPTTQGYEWRVFLGDHLPTTSDQVATTTGADGDYVLTRSEQVATIGGYLPTNSPSPRGESSGAGDGDSSVGAGAAEPIEARYRVTPAEIEQAIERTSARYVADVHTLFDRVSAEVGRLYEAQLAAKDQALAAQDGRIAAQQETIAALRRRAEAAEAERDDLCARLDTVQATPMPPSQAVGGAGAAEGVDPATVAILRPTAPLVQPEGNVEGDSHPTPPSLWQRLLQRLRGG